MAPARPATVRKTRPLLSETQKASRRNKFLALTSDVTNAHNTLSNEVQTISKKHGRSQRWTRRQLYFSDLTRRNTRRPTAWNGFIHQRLDDVNEKLEKGSRWRLPDFISTHKETLLHDFQQLSEDQKNGYAIRLMQHRTKKQSIVRDQPRAVQRRMTTAFDKMDKEWTSLCSGLGIEGFYVAVRGGVEDLSGPKLFFSEKADKFVRSVLDLEPRRLALKLEAFTVAGLADKVDSTSTHRPRALNKLISECRSTIQKSLEEILHENKVTEKVHINYDNYERKIVERFGVELVGWPNNLLPIRNPGRIGTRDQVQNLLDALTTKVCHWKKLTTQELEQRITHNTERQARGAQVYKPRKKRSIQSTAKSAEIISDNGDDAGNDRGSADT